MNKNSKRLLNATSVLIQIDINDKKNNSLFSKWSMIAIDEVVTKRLQSSGMLINDFQTDSLRLLLKDIF
jgi:hypothetical protein